MRTRYSIILPIAAILSGVVLELNSLNLIGNFLPNDLLLKLWPVLLVFAGLDMIFSERRLIGGMVILFFSAALLSTQFMAGGWNNQIWQFFMKVWPILLVLFGIDCIFSGRKLLNAAVIIAGVIILVYVLLTVLDVPALKSLPINIDLTSIIPTSTFEGLMPSQSSQNQVQFTMPQMFSQPTAPETQESVVIEPLTVTANGDVFASMPAQNSASLNLNAASGTISLKADTALNSLLGGSIRLDLSENLSKNANVSGQTAQYSISSQGNAASPQNSSWDLSLSNQRAIAINTVLNSGYIKADLRNLNLSDVYLENKYGPIDVMVPAGSSAKIQLRATGDKVRVYVPSGTSVVCTISGTSNITYPQYNYTLSGSMLSPRRASQQPISVEITVNSGSVEIIEIG